MTVNVWVFVLALLMSGSKSTLVNIPTDVVAIRYETQFQLAPPWAVVVTVTETVIAPFGETVTVAPPLTVALLIVRSSLKLPLTVTAEVNPTAV